MTGEVRFSLIFNYWWEELKWSGNFPVRWIYIKDLHHDAVAHLQADNMSVTRLKDGSYVPRAVGVEILHAFRSTEFISDIFEAFKFMDGREEKLRYKRDKILAYIVEMKVKGVLPANSANTYKYHSKKNGRSYNQREERDDERLGFYDYEYVKKYY